MAIVAVLTEKIQRKTSEQVTTWFAVNEDLVLHELGAEQVWQVLCASRSVFKYSKRDLRILHLFFRLFRDGSVSVTVLNAASFLQAMLKTVTRQPASTKALLFSGIAGPTAFQAPILLHSFSAVNLLTKKRLSVPICYLALVP